MFERPHHKSSNILAKDPIIDTHTAHESIGKVPPIVQYLMGGDSDDAATLLCACLVKLSSRE